MVLRGLKSINNLIINVLSEKRCGLGLYFRLTGRPGFPFYRKTGPLYVYKYTNLSPKF